MRNFGFANRRVTGRTWLFAPLLAVLAIAGCGSSSSSSSTSASSGSSASTSSSAPASTGTSSGVSAKVTAAEAVPTAIDQTVPLKSKPPAGKTIIWLKCELSQCADIGNGVSAGAKALGWSYSEINWKSTDPTTLITAMGQALQKHPFGVGFSGIPQAVWQSQLPTFEKAGVKLFPVVTGPLSTKSSAIPTEIGDFNNAGKALGEWMISDSGGKGHALLVDLPAFPILTGIVKGAAAAISADCPGCATTSFNGTLPEVTSGQFVPGVVNALKKDPSIKYVLDSDSIFVASLPAALKAAGLSGVKIAGGQPEPTDLSNIQAGKDEFAAVLDNNVMRGWVAIDSLARSAEGMDVPEGDGGQPAQLLTKDNIKGTDINTYAVPPNYQQLFMKLWQVK